MTKLIDKIKNYLSLKDIILFCLSLFLIIHSYPNTYFYSSYFAWIALVPLLLIIQNKSYKKIFTISYLFGLISLSTILHLNFNTLLYRIDSNLVILIFVLTLILPLVIAIPFSTGLYLSQNMPYYITPLILASCWVAFEYLLLHSPASFPYTIGLTQFNQVFIIQIASITGIYGVSFLIIFVNISLFISICMIKEYKKFLIIVSISVFLILSTLIYGQYQIFSHIKEENNATIKVAVIQPNILWEKIFFSTFSNMMFEDIISRFHILTKQAIKESSPDLIVWTEGIANRYIIQDENLYKSTIPQFLSKEKLIFGSPYYLYNTNMGMNSAFLYDPEQHGIIGKYDKVHIVPLYESSIYKAGDESKPIIYDKYKLGIMICLESVYPDTARQLVDNGASLLILIANDSWFGTTSWPVLHAAMLPFRAVENNRWAVHANNNGPSLIVDNKGYILQATPFAQQSIAIANIRWVNETTFYTKFGDVFALFCMILIGILLLSKGVMYITMKSKQTI